MILILMDNQADKLGFMKLLSQVSDETAIVKKEALL